MFHLLSNQLLAFNFTITITSTIKMSELIYKHPRIFISGWFVFFAAIVAVPATVILVLKNSHSADFWLDYGVASLIAAAIVAAWFASVYTSEAAPSLSKSTWFGALIALVSLLVSGFIASILGGLFRPDVSMLSGLFIFPAALLFAGWAVVPVGAIAGFVLHYFNPYASGKNKGGVAGLVGYFGIVLLLVNVVLLFNPFSILHSSEYVQRSANWYKCCKYPNGFGSSGRFFVELVFYNDKKEREAIHYLNNTPQVQEYLQKLGSEQVSVTFEVKSYLGKRLTYRIARIGDLDISGHYMKPVKSIENILAKPDLVGDS